MRTARADRRPSGQSFARRRESRLSRHNRFLARTSLIRLQSRRQASGYQFLSVVRRESSASSPEPSRSSSASGKRPHCGPSFPSEREYGRLLDLGFLKLDVLPDLRIILLKRQLFRSVSGVLFGRVERPGASGANQLDQNGGGLGHNLSLSTELDNAHGR